MIESSVLHRLKNLVEPLCLELGLNLWGLEKLGAPGHMSILRVYVDSAQGVDVEVCARLSRRLSLLLDVEDLIPGRYRLEVSSPGMERRFFTLDQLLGFVGRKVTARLTEPVDGSRTLNGIVHDVDLKGNTVFVAVDEKKPLDVAWSTIQKIHLVVDDPFQAPRPRKTGSAGNHSEREET